MNTQIFYHVLIIFMVLFLGITPAHAVHTELQSHDYLQTKLLSDQITNHDTVDAALLIRLSRGWHTYWRASGDAGLPPQFDWSESENIQSVDVIWPTPKRFKEHEFTTFGYSGDVTFPLVVKLETPNQPANLKLNANVMVCMDICIPEQFNMTLDIPVSKGTPDGDTALIKSAYRRTPATDNAKHIGIHNVVVSKDALVATVSSQGRFTTADIFVATYDGEIALTAKPDIQIDPNDKTRAIIRLEKPNYIEDLHLETQGQSLIVIFTDQKRAVQKMIQLPAPSDAKNKKQVTAPYR